MDMTTAQTTQSITRKPLRLWPGVALAMLLLLLRVGIPAVVADTEIYGVLGGLAVGAAIFLWWLFFSRAPWVERIGVLLFMAVAMFATSFVVDESIASGFMGRMLFVFGTPFLALALVAGAVASRNVSIGRRRATIAAAILLTCGAFTVVRTGGITGDAASDLHWRWSETAEERLLARSDQSAQLPPAAPAPTVPPPTAVPVAPPTPEKPAEAAVVPTPAERPARPAMPAAPATATAPASVKLRAQWPGFRGPERDGVIRGVRIETDWTTSPPVELWRRPIGPGWSSFAVQGDLFYTQEQRGEDEIVSCYRLTTGQPVWSHRDPVRFYESNGGAGPRGTPTLHDGRVYTFGATGILNALDATNGAVIWSRNAASDTSVEVPGWGFTSSPLVVNDVVIVATSGRLVAYDAVTGQQRWLGPTGGSGYSSPHLVTIDGVDQILLLRGSRTISVAPADGTLLWEHTWQPGVGIVQPARADRDVLIVTGDAMGGLGIRRLAVSKAASGWSAEERWTTRGLKPYFNDFVVHNGYAFGFDGSILAAIDLKDGERKWKGGRYGHGQMVLLPDQDLLLVLSEEGELALVNARPDRHTEVARFKAIEGKTWNHPVLADDILLVRNGEEMAAFRLAMEGRSTTR
jgi:outer membrane protein assembly factor BamB